MRRIRLGKSPISTYHAQSCSEGAKPFAHPLRSHANGPLSRQMPPCKPPEPGLSPPISQKRALHSPSARGPDPGSTIIRNIQRHGRAFLAAVTLHCAEFEQSQLGTRQRTSHYVYLTHGPLGGSDASHRGFIEMSTWKDEPKTFSHLRSMVSEARGHPQLKAS